MTQQELPDPLGFLLSDPTSRSTPEAPADAVFPTRRELRARREAEERAAREAEAVEQAPAESAAVEQVAVEQVPVETVPVVPAAPVQVVVETLAEPEALAPTRGRAARRGRPGGRRVDVARRRTTRQRITGTATMLVVGGIFASLTLPAYAFGDHDSAATAGVQDTSTQNLRVAVAAAPASVRDAYSATSASDLRALYLAATRQKNMTSYAHTTAQAMGDDYPWYAALDRGQGGGLSPLRYYYRECVDFVAWRLNRDAGYTAAPFKWDWSTLTPGNGNASGWKAAWLAHGWATGTQPQAGAVAWFPANHVAYVNSVLPDGSVLLEEYNYNTDHQYGQRIVPASSVPLYLYAPPR